jgi:hypothetical protein
MFDNIRAHVHRYTAGIVVPVEAHETKHEILKFTQRFAKPVLFLDVQPFDSEDDYPPDTVYRATTTKPGERQPLRPCPSFCLGLTLRIHGFL